MPLMMPPEIGSLVLSSTRRAGRHQGTCCSQLCQAGCARGEPSLGQGDKEESGSV